MAGDRPRQPAADIPTPELSQEGLEEVVEHAVELTLDSRTLNAEADTARPRTYEKGEKLVQSGKVGKKASRIAKILDRILPLPEDARWRDEIRRLADAREESLDN